MFSSILRIVSWVAAIGFTSFALGFFGPLILDPGANQGPLLGILITGPLGTVAGFVIGIFREIRGYTTGPFAVLRQRI